MTPASDSLRADHRRIETHLDSLLDALKHLGAERVEDVRHDFREIQRLANRHMEQEERVFYPQLRPLASEVLSRMDKQHEEMRQTERCLDELLACFPEAPADRDLRELYRLGIEFHDAVQVHIVEEEEHLLKLADRLLSLPQQEHLLAAMHHIVAEEST